MFHFPVFFPPLIFHFKFINVAAIHSRSDIKELYRKNHFGPNIPVRFKGIPAG